MTELERDLRELGLALDFPATPQLAHSVGRLVRAQARPRPRVSRRSLAIALAVLLAAVGALLAVPSTRSAILDLFGLDGVTIERVDTLPPARRAPDPVGSRVSLADAQRAVPYRILQPERPVGRVYLDRSIPGGRVSIVWPCCPRVVLSQFRGEALPFIEKSAGRGTRIEAVTVNGGFGYWLSGRPHVVVYRDARGVVREETLRLAGNVLLWEQEGRTLRLEGQLTKQQALDLARGVR